MDKTAKILLGAIAAGVGLAYYFFRKSDTNGPMSDGELEKIIGDKSEIDFLHEILEYLRAEYTTFYIHYSNLIREATNSYGHNHELVKATIIEVMDRLEEKLHHTDEKVWAKFNINQATLENLIEKHQTSHWKYVKKLTMQNKQRVMNGEEIDFELPFPRQISKDLYAVIINSVLGDMREQVDAIIKERGFEIITKEDMADIFKSL